MKNSNTSPSSIYKKLRRIIAKPSPIIRGSLVVMNRFCGKANCRCLRGYKHRSLYLSRSVKGKTTMKYIPKDREEKIKEASLHYKKIQNLLNQLSEINTNKLMTKSK